MLQLGVQVASGDLGSEDVRNLRRRAQAATGDDAVSGCPSCEVLKPQWVFKPQGLKPSSLPPRVLVITHGE